MSGKTAKKIRKLYRKDLGQKVNEQVQMATEKLGDLLKPAPRWIPEFIWVSLQRIFLNI
jgi:hypothetical protein